MNFHYRKWLSNASAERSASLRKGAIQQVAWQKPRLSTSLGTLSIDKPLHHKKKTPKIRLDNYLQCQWCRDSPTGLNHSNFTETNRVQFCPFAKNFPAQVQAAQMSVSDSCQRGVFSESNPLYSQLLQVSDLCPCTQVGPGADDRNGFSFLSRH